MSVYTILKSVSHKNSDIEVINFTHDSVNRLTVSSMALTAVVSANSLLTCKIT